MPSEADELIANVLRTVGAPMTVFAIRAALRQQGRTLSEEMIARVCAASPRIRAISGGRFALLSQLMDETESSAVDEEQPLRDQGTLLHIPLLRKGSYVVADLETTGLDPTRDAIIQIGAVRIRDGQLDGIFFEPVNAGNRILSRMLRRTLNIPEDGHMDRLIREAPPPAQVVPRFLNFLGADLLVAHNGQGLDFPFLVAQGVSANHPTLDSLELAFLACPDSTVFNLQALASLAKVADDSPEIASVLASDPRLVGAGAHNALFDAVMLHLVIRYLLKRIAAELHGETAYGRTLRVLLGDLLEDGRLADGALIEVLRGSLSPKGFPTPQQGAARAHGAPLAPENAERHFGDFVADDGREVRRGQSEMVGLVARALVEGGTHVIEAATPL